MATLILGIAGSVVGNIIAPGIGGQLGFAIGSTVGGYIDESRKHIYTAPMGRLNDLSVNVASYGTSIPQCWGSNRVPFIFIWGSNLVEHETDVNSGGGSGGPKVTTQVYSYTVSIAAILCKGNPNVRVQTIFANDLTIFDRTTTGNTITPINVGGTQVGESIKSSLYPNVTIRYYFGSEIQNADPVIISSASNIDIPAGSDNPAFRGQCYIILQDFLLTDFGNSIPNLSAIISTGITHVSDVLTDISTELGLNVSTQLDVSRSTSTQITGLMVQQRIDAKSAFQPILDAYATDFIDVDGVVRSIPRGLNTVGTITWNDLGASIVNSGPAPPVQRILKTRSNQFTLPKRIDVGYVSPTINYQSATQGAVRQSAYQNNYVSVNYPLTLTDSEASSLAARLLYLDYVEDTQYKATGMPYLSPYTVSDCLMVQTDSEGTLTRLRITSAEEGLPGEITYEFVKDDDSTYTQGSVPSSVSGVNVSTPPIPTQFFAFSGKELRDADTTLAGFYVAATGATGWQGCAVIISIDGGGTYQNVGSVGARSVFGSVTSSLGGTYTPDSQGFDVTNTVTVNTNGALSSTNETDVKGGYGNYGIILKTDTSVDGRADYEILGFANANLISTNQYTLSTLLRSQRGTNVTGHTSTDTFIEATNSLQRIAVAASLVGTTILVKCVSPGIAPSSVTPQSVYIVPPTGVYATTASVSSQISTAIAGISVPTVPVWRVKGYESGISSAGVDIDYSYFTGSNLPSGVTVRNFTYTANSIDGSIMMQTTLPFVFWYRIGIVNPTSGAISINHWIPYIDNGLTMYLNTTLIYQSHSANDVSGSFSIPANSTATLDVLMYNQESTSYPDDSTNPGTFNFVILSNMQSLGLSFVDTGPF